MDTSPCTLKLKANKKEWPIKHSLMATKHISVYKALSFQL